MVAEAGMAQGVLDHHNGVRPHARQHVADALQARHAGLVQTDPGLEHGQVVVQHRDHGVGGVERRAGDRRQPVKGVPPDRFARCPLRNHDPHNRPLHPARRIIR
ncbi:hypothetical protein D3C81_2066030 [compost metagenome]